MATTGEHSLTLDTMGNYFKNLLIRNYSLFFNKIWGQFCTLTPLPLSENMNFKKSPILNCVPNSAISDEGFIFRPKIKL
jgi:hypothetical protein